MFLQALLNVIKLCYICLNVIQEQNNEIMTTITLKINERSSYGKALLELIKVGINEKKGIEMVEEESPYNADFVKKVKESAASQERYEVKDVNELWNSL